MRAAAGPFYAAAGVQTDKTAEALTEFFKELDGIRKPIPAEELEKAKNYVALLLPRNFETTERLAAIAWRRCSSTTCRPDYYATYTRARPRGHAGRRAARRRAVHPARQVRGRRRRRPQGHRAGHHARSISGR